MQEKEAVRFGQNTSKSTRGYKLAKYVREQCNQNGYYYKFDAIRLNQKYATKSKKLQFCPVWKVGTTFIKRLFMIENLPTHKNYTNPYLISFSESYSADRGMISNKDDSKKFMFVRNPYQRLLSCYVDKLLAPNPVYWRLLGVPAIQTVRKDKSRDTGNCGHDLTFSEFIKYVITAMGIPERGFLGKARKKVGIIRDLHFEQLTVVCKPCHLKYDFVGKMESFKDDSIELMNQMNLTNVAKFIEQNGESLAAEDAINDTVSQPFYPEFKRDYLNCITEKEALERAWLKLQTRGLIGNKSLEISEDEAKQQTFDTFQRMAMVARKNSTKEERSAMKHYFFQKMYKTVPREDLEKISRLYQDDFHLFEYDSRPADLFPKEVS